MEILAAEIVGCLFRESFLKFGIELELELLTKYYVSYLRQL
jgi:hypothetical protein